MKYKQFKGQYDKVEFYSLMGKFFAERKYRKLMPYLFNDEDLVWNIIENSDEVDGFISYKERGNKVNIGYCYSEDKKLYKKLLNSIPQKNTFIELEKDFDKSIYEKLGYEVYKESKNYWYMELIINENLSK